jgi:Sec-independent protein translocase protein TatA
MPGSQITVTQLLLMFVLALLLFGPNAWKKFHR